MDQRLIRPELLGDLAEFRLIEAVHMGRVEVEAPGIESLLGVVVDVSKRYGPADRVEAIAQRLRFAQVVHLEIGFVSEQPCEDRRRVPIAADCALHDREARIDPAARHFVEIHVPVARFFRHEQPQRVS